MTQKLLQLKRNLLITVMTDILLMQNVIKLQEKLLMQD